MHHCPPPLVVSCLCVPSGIDFLAPFSSFNFADYCPPKCFLLPALAPNPASWRKERRRCSCLVPTANLGANSAKRAMWHFSERLAAWEEGGSVYHWPCWNTQFHNSSHSPVAPAFWPLSAGSISFYKLALLACFQYWLNNFFLPC